MEYGIYKDTDLINVSEITKNCNELKAIATQWRSNIGFINKGLMDFTDDIMNIEGKSFSPTFVELVKKMSKHADELEEYADAIIKKATAIEAEEKDELSRHKKEAEEAERARKEAAEMDKKNQYTNTVPVSGTTAYSSGGGNTVGGSSNSVGNNVVY